jgi:hypothetical protein
VLRWHLQRSLTDRSWSVGQFSCSNILQSHVVLIASLFASAASSKVEWFFSTLAYDASHGGGNHCGLLDREVHARDREPLSIKILLVVDED